MISTAQVEEELLRAVPVELHPDIPSLARTIVETLQRGLEDSTLSPIVRGREVTDEGTRSLLAHLAGQELTLDTATLSFGQGNQFGDITIHDVAGRDVIKQNISVTIILPGANPSSQLSAEELAGHERAFVEDLRHNLLKLLPRAQGPRKGKSVTIPVRARSRSGDSRLYKTTDLHRSHERLLLVGEGGAGKTTSLLAIAVRVANDFLQRAGRADGKLPVFIDLRLVEHSFRGLVLDTLRPMGLNADGVDEYLRLGRFFFFIDGLNELPERVREEAITDLARLTNPLGPYRNNRVIITTRPLENIALFRGMPVFEIQGFGRNEVRAFVERYFHGRAASAERLLQRLRIDDEQQWSKPRSLSSLAANPMILSWIAELSLRNDYEIPTSRSRLVADLTRKRLEWESEHGRAHRFRFADKEQALADLAHFMIASPTNTTYMPLDEARAYARDAWPGGEAMLDEIVANGLLRVSSDRRGLAWMHQLIQDFFGARWLERELRQGRSLQEVSLVEWEEPVVFLAGLLNSPDDYIAQITALNPFLGARCYCAADTLRNRTRLRSQLVKQLSSQHLSVWTLSGDVQQIADVVKEEAHHSRDPDTYVVLGKLLESLGLYEEALDTFRILDQIQNISVDRRFEVLCNEANLSRRRGNHEIALDLLEQAENLARLHGYIQRNDLLYYEKAYIYEREGQVRKAISAYNQSYKAGLAIGKPERAFIAVAQAGVVLVRSGHARQGEHLLRRSLAVFETAPERNLRWIFNTRSHLIDAMIAQRSFPEARQLLEWSAREMPPTGSKRGHVVDRLRRQGSLALHMGEYRQALSYFRETLEILESAPALESERVADVLYMLALCQIQLGLHDEAHHLLTQSVAQPLQQYNAWGISQAALRLATMSREAGDWSVAREHARRASELAWALHATWYAEARTLLRSLARS